MNHSSHLKVLLTWYNHNDRQLAGEEVIDGLNEASVLNLFNIPFWNHAYLCNALETKQQIKTLQHSLHHRINTQEHSYFLEMFKLDDPAIENQRG